MRPEAKTRLNAHAVVVSRQTVPVRATEERIAQGVRDLPWSWISAGVERQTGSHRSKRNLLDAGVPGLLGGRHKALEACKEDILIYLDDDVTLPTGWIERILEPFADPDIHFVGCRYLPDYEHKPPSWLEGLWQEVEDDFRVLHYLSLLDGGVSARLYRPTFVWGLCFAVRRETLIKLSGFNPDAYPWELRRFRGDGESGLALKAEMVGLKAYYQGKTHVMHRVPASRMTPEYFERRSFLEGISDSYAMIRRDHGIWVSHPRSWRDYIRPAKWKLERELILRRPTAEGVQKLTVRSRLSGMQFHKNEVRNDPKLLEWVLRKNYFDYRLPDGWEQYLDAALRRGHSSS
jgi:glycosyltransferase involved in cell wall biosynthesis